MQRSSTPAGGLVITAHASFSNEAACWAAAKQTADAAAREGTTAVRQGTRWQWHAVSPGEPVVLGQTWCGTVE